MSDGYRMTETIHRPVFVAGLSWRQKMLFARGLLVLAALGVAGLACAQPQSVAPGINQRFLESQNFGEFSLRARSARAGRSTLWKSTPSW